MASKLKYKLTFACLLLTCSLTLAQDYDSLIQQSVQARNSGNMEQAEALLRQAYEIPPNKSEVIYLLGLVVAFQERFSEAISIIDEGLDLYPYNVSLQLARARVLSYQSQFLEAQDITDDVLGRDPENIEALNLAGRIAINRQQPNRAKNFFLTALTLNTMDLEALIGLYDASMATGDREEAEEYLAEAQTIAPEHIDVLTRLNPLQFDSSPRHQIIAGFERSRFERLTLAEWNDRFIEYRHLSSTGNQQYVRAEHNHRFGQHDSQLELGMLTRQRTALPLEFAIGFTDEADFMADYFGRVGARRILREASQSLGTLVMTGNYQYSSYNNGSTNRILLGLEYYMLNANAWLTPSVGVVRDQNGTDTFSWTLGGHWQVTGGTRLGFNYSDAPETENLITTDTRVRHIYISQNLSSRLVLQINYTENDRKNSYLRKNINAVVQYRF